MAVQIFLPLDPFDLLEVCQRVEASLGRQRLFFHAPRTIDIDILWLDRVTIKSSLLTIPHPRLEQRAFVIFPLAQIAPDIILPSGSPIFAVKKAVGGDEIVEVCKMHL
jgi:2-amino-4-hydroxy-6-hydroxymethyldihydropteridine diphosphokinase